jgi:hypothetical protein
VCRDSVWCGVAARGPIRLDPLCSSRGHASDQRSTVCSPGRHAPLQSLGAWSRASSGAASTERCPRLWRIPRVKSPEMALALRLLDTPVASLISRAVSPSGCWRSRATMTRRRGLHIRACSRAGEPGAALVFAQTFALSPHRHCHSRCQRADASWRGARPRGQAEARSSDAPAGRGPCAYCRKTRVTRSSST